MENRSNRSAARKPQEEARPFAVWKALVALVLIVAVAFAAQLCSTAATISVTVNGTELTLHGAKTLQTAIKESGLPINPGDLISLRGQVLEKHAGESFYATVNGKETTDAGLKLHNGDEIALSDGLDIVETYTSTYEPIAYSSATGGLGALHIFESGREGTMEIRTGDLSGEQVRKVVEEPVDIIRRCYNPDVGDDPVIALTFDDGPSRECTGDVLDVLAENGAKATFFVVGAEIISDEDRALVQRAFDEGHELCTHTFSYSQSISQFDYSSLTADEQVAEIRDGWQAIAAVTGVEPSHAVRLPGGTMDDLAVLNVGPHISAEIGWTLDTGDWLIPGADAICDVLMQSQPGDIVLMHDAAYSAQTVEALKVALPRLKEKGYEFVTVDEMLAYPAEQSG